MNATTSPLSAPLPGGSDGAVVTVRLWGTGEMGVPAGYLYREAGALGRAKTVSRGAARKFECWVPCPVFFVEHPTAGRIVIDTGLPAALAHDKVAALGRMRAQMFATRMSADQSAPARMRSLGLTGRDIAAVVMTHLHFDHAGALAELGEHAPVVVTAAEWHEAHGGSQITRGYYERQFDRALDYRLVDFDGDVIGSHATFGRSWDLFGDGSVVLVATPGHSHGHMSVILRTASHEVLIAGDAILTHRSLERGELPMNVADERKYRQTLSEIRGYVERTPTAIVVPGHDPEALAPLDGTLL